MQVKWQQVLWSQRDRFNGLPPVPSDQGRSWGGGTQPNSALRRHPASLPCASKGLGAPQGTTLLASLFSSSTDKCWPQLQWTENPAMAKLCLSLRHKDMAPDWDLTLQALDTLQHPSWHCKPMFEWLTSKKTQSFVTWLFSWSLNSRMQSSTAFPLKENKENKAQGSHTARGQPCSFTYKTIRPQRAG